MKSIQLIKQIKRNILIKFFVIVLLLGANGCNDFLEVIPDNITNLEHVFATRETAENYLATLYTHVPAVFARTTVTNSEYYESSLCGNILWFGADDAWTFYENNYKYNYPWRIARGEQNVSSPLLNAWDGWEGMNSMFYAIRDCNIFIEEMQKPERAPEVGKIDRARWIAEACFLKAYYHFYLFRMYGPIPITDVNIDVSASPEITRVKRDPVDDVVNYIANLLDKAAADLPLELPNKQIEEGRATRGAALTLKAKVLVTAASDLFNGNSDYSHFVDNDNVHLFPVNKWGDEVWMQKWQRAAEACKEALEALPEKELHYTANSYDISDPIRYQLNLREAVTERYNKEIIWTRRTNSWTIESNVEIMMLPPRLDGVPYTTGGYISSYASITLGMAERFYSKNGIPIDEDNTYDYANRYKVTEVGIDQTANLISGYKTARLNLNRENRFYASLLFDGARAYWNKYGKETDWLNNQNSCVYGTFGQINGLIGGTQNYTETGYFIQKLTSLYFAGQTTSPWATVGGKWYQWPEFRLADLYLLYAEALNEIDKPEEAIVYIDRIRARSGLKGVKEAWGAECSKDKSKPSRKDGLREIIHQEREIELAFEGQRFWDLRRWKKAANFQNKTVMGWNTSGKDAAEYYQPVVLFNQQFVTPRDYLWPISTYSLRRNPNLVQNPGW
ncbi:MAG: RagB/SusD family nutrient uptake outer membrane protein [Dysgonamonadaceae bacterium]|jgi:hypothetical protein|nr:RagB/SusD family nutrient uptake outer membrane protein [Dysgonamonadaceae bacterium]